MPLQDEIAELLSLPADGVGAPTLATLERRLTHGYAEALALDADRLRVERRRPARAQPGLRLRPAAHRLSLRPLPLFALAVRTFTAYQAAAERCVASPQDSRARRCRIARRRPPPGCGCRSGAS